MRVQLAIRNLKSLLKTDLKVFHTAGSRQAGLTRHLCAARRVNEGVQRIAPRTPEPKSVALTRNGCMAKQKCVHVDSVERPEQDSVPILCISQTARMLGNKSHRNPESDCCSDRADKADEAESAGRGSSPQPLALFSRYVKKGKETRVGGIHPGVHPGGNPGDPDDPD